MKPMFVYANRKTNAISNAVVVNHIKLFFIFIFFPSVQAPFFRMPYTKI